MSHSILVFVDAYINFADEEDVHSESDIWISIVDLGKELS